MTRSRAEAREATILFADILGFGELAAHRSPDEAFAIVTRCLSRLDEVARRHGGAIDKYLGDCLMGVFGFPLESEQAERDAVSAALDMRQMVQHTRDELELGDDFDVRIGINTGPILAGDVSGQVIREFAVMGDTVNLAARLKAGAPPGGIHVGPATKAAAGPGFHFQALPETQVKGRKQRVQPFSVLGHDEASDSSGDTTRFCELIGRDAELQVLEDSIAGLRSGRGGIVWISGDHGMGKSRLVDEIVARHPSLRFETLPLAAFNRDMAPGPGALSKVWVLEDGHLAGEDAADAFRDWLTLIPALPVLVVVLARSTPHLDPVRERAGMLGDRFVAIDLEPLAVADAVRLVDALSSADPLDSETRALVAQRAEGNPSSVIHSVFLADALRADASRSGSREARGDDAERRRTTVLFADLTGFTALAERSDPHELHDLVTSCLGEMSEIARRHGGTVEKHLGDCILAVYGAPVAMEEAPRAAINAAIEMRDRVAAFNQERSVDPPLRLHTGIATGLGIAGEVSGPVIREFTLMGESVADASTLMDLAPPDSIFVGPETTRATSEWFEFLERGAAAFELDSTETKLHREVGHRRRVTSELVGREAELASLQEAIAALSEGRGGAVAVIGDAGLGKTRLVQEMLENLDGVVSYKGRSLATGQNLSFHPIKDLLSRWCGIEDGEDENRSLARVVGACDELFGGKASEVTPFITTLMGLPPPESERERLERISGEAMSSLILGAVTRLLREGAARTPLILVFEDLHWADLSSIELIESLLRLSSDHPILMLGMLRPRYEKTGERFREVATAQLGPRYREIVLDPLGADAALGMVRNLFRGGDVPPTLLAAVRERAQGNPFYVEEVVRGLVDTGALVEREGRLEATDRITEVPIPGTIQEVVMARVDGLPRPRRELLRAASAIGGTFHVEVLTEIVGKDDLDEKLFALVEAEIIEPRNTTGEFRFKHPLIQEVVYEGLVAGRRESLHRQIGAAIEAHVGPNTPGYYAQLAFHYSRGRDLERAEAHLFRAGDEAARAAASDEALDFFREASELYVQLHRDAGDADADKLSLLERNMALALANRGRYVEAIQHFDDALRHRGVPVSNNRLVLGTRLVRDLVVVLGRLYFPGSRRIRPPATDVQRAVQELIYERARAQTTSAMGRYLFDWMDGLRRLDSADPRTMPLAGGQFASTVGIFSFGGLSFSVSERFLALAKGIVRESDPVDQMIYGFMNHFHRMLAGDWDDVHELPDDLIEDRIRNGQLFDVANYLAISAEKHINQGRFEESLAIMERLQEIADLYQNDLAVSGLHGLTSFLYVEQELWPEAVEAADLYYTEHDAPLINILALGTKAKAQVLGGDPDGAAGTLEIAERMLSSAAGVVPPFYRSAVLRSRLLLEIEALQRSEGNPRAAKKAARAAISVAFKVASRSTEIFRLEGTRRALTMRGRGADAWWDRAQAQAEALGMVPELERIERARALGKADKPRV